VARNQESRALLTAVRTDQLDGLLRVVRIETRCGFIGEDEGRAAGQGAGHCDTLLLSDRERLDERIGPVNSERSE